MKAGIPVEARGLTGRIVELVTEPGYADPASTKIAERALIDIVGVTMAAVAEPSVISAVGALQGRDSGGPSTVLVNGRATGAPTAALLGGLSAHALDYDDVDDAFIGHPSAVLIPALLAVGEALDVTGADVLDAFTVGLRTCRRIAAVLGIRPHYELGWHSTATIGALGATAAVARLSRLTGVQTRHALGIAGSLAAGSRQNFGTMTKPLHAGTAAECGVRSVQLAGAGFTADTTQLEGSLGFLALHAGSHLDRDSHDALLDAIAENELLPLNVKLYPCCYFTHSAGDAVLELAQSGLRGAEVAEMHVTVQPGGLAPLIHHRPTNGLEAKFSMEYVVAVGLLDRHLSFESFADDRIRGADVQTLLRRVTVSEADTPPVGAPEKVEAFTVLQGRTTDASTIELRVDRPLGHATRPATDERLRTKFDECLSAGGFDSTRRAAAHKIVHDFGSTSSVATSMRELSTILHDTPEEKR